MKLQIEMRRRLLRAGITKPIKMHPIVRASEHGRGKTCCLCKQRIAAGSLYHSANDRAAHVVCYDKGAA